MWANFLPGSSVHSLPGVEGVWTMHDEAKLGTVWFLHRLGQIQPIQVERFVSMLSQQNKNQATILFAYTFPNHL